MLVLFFAFLFTNISFAWWDSNWQYREPITIRNYENFSLNNYPTKVVINTQKLIAEGKMNENCSDIRIVDEDDTTPLDYWIVDGTCNTTKTQIWIKPPTLPALSDIVIYMYYGNPNAYNTLSNIRDTFPIISDDFNDGTYTGEWDCETENYGSCLEHDGYVVLKVNSPSNDFSSAHLKWKNPLNLSWEKYSLIFKMRYELKDTDGVSHRAGASLQNSGTEVRYGKDMGWDAYNKWSYSVYNYWQNEQEYTFISNIFTDSDWHEFRIDNINIDVDNETIRNAYVDGEAWDILHKNITIGSVNHVVLISEGYENEMDAYFDYIFIKPYTEKEPKAFLGEEQKQDISNWTYITHISIVNPDLVEAKDYTAEIIVDTRKPILEGKMNPDCSDIRVATSDGKILPNYWIADGTCFTNHTTIYVKIPNIPAYTTGKTILRLYLLYGNPQARYEGDINKVGIVGDDFNDNSFNTSKWYSIKDLTGYINGYEIEHNGVYEYGVNGTSAVSTIAGLEYKKLLPLNIKAITYAYSTFYDDTGTSYYGYPLNIFSTDGSLYAYNRIYRYIAQYMLRAVSNGTVYFDNVVSNTEHNNLWNYLSIAINNDQVSYLLNESDNYSSPFVGVSPLKLQSKMKLFDSSNMVRQHHYIIKLDYLLIKKFYPNFKVVPSEYEFENPLTSALPTHLSLTLYRENVSSSISPEFSFMINTEAYKEKGIIYNETNIRISPTPSRWTYKNIDGQTIYILNYDNTEGIKTIDVDLGVIYSTPNYYPDITTKAQKSNMIFKSLAEEDGTGLALATTSNYVIFGSFIQELRSVLDTYNDMVIAGAETTQTAQSYGWLYVWNGTGTTYRIGTGTFIPENAYFTGDKVFLYGDESGNPTIYTFDLEKYNTEKYYNRTTTYSTYIKGMDITRDYLIISEFTPLKKEAVIRYLDNYYRDYEYSNITINLSSCSSPQLLTSLFIDENHIVNLIDCDGNRYSLIYKTNPLNQSQTINTTIDIDGVENIVDYTENSNQLIILYSTETSRMDYYIVTIDKDTLQYSIYKFASYPLGKTYFKDIIPTAEDKLMVTALENINNHYYITARELSIEPYNETYDMDTYTYAKSYYHSNIFLGQASIISEVSIPNPYISKKIHANRETFFDIPTKATPLTLYSYDNSYLYLENHFLYITYPSHKPTITLNNCQEVGTGRYTLNITNGVGECLKIEGDRVIIDGGTISGTYAGKLIKVENSTAFIIDGVVLNGTYTDGIYIYRSGGDIANTLFRGTSTNLIHGVSMTPATLPSPTFLTLFNNTFNISGTILLENSMNNVLTLSYNYINQDDIIFDLGNSMQNFFYKNIFGTETEGYIVYPQRQYRGQNYVGAGFQIPLYVGNIWINSTGGLSNKCRDTNKDYLCDEQQQVDGLNSDIGVVNLKLHLPQLTHADISTEYAQAKIDIPNQLTKYDGFNVSMSITSTDLDSNLEKLGYEITGENTYSDERTYPLSYQLSDTFYQLLPSGTWTFKLYSQDYATYQDQYTTTKDYTNPQDIYAISPTKWERTNEITANTEIDKVREVIPIATAQSDYYFNGLLTYSGATTCKVNGNQYVVSNDLCPYYWEVSNGDEPPRLIYNDDVLGSGIPIKQNDSDFIIDGSKIYKNTTLSYYNIDGTEATAGTFTNVTSQVICNDNQVETGEYIAIWINGTKEDITPEQQGVWTEFNLTDGRQVWVLKDDLCYQDGVMDFKVKISSNG